eukprot:CAMPEP_0118905960 /NCGR_PEP_ID=MMETSP1166-20130328/9710_1 /TAXON_ID=1104430 /ORGANISM="Chrysoreinhardia sp, Strain CCMP3193" /LENGTH=451 /DNA_ID=CAMNT_0006845231 /DNA_START=25 /DNA_END=1380 /DNA_ORIENTATION=-
MFFLTSALIVEARNHVALDWVIQNVRSALPEVPIYLHHGTGNSELAEAIASRTADVTLRNLNVSNLTMVHYSTYLTSTGLYSSLPAGHTLVFQTDAGICDPAADNLAMLRPFEDYDYAGAPWAWWTGTERLLTGAISHVRKTAGTVYDGGRLFSRPQTRRPTNDGTTTGVVGLPASVTKKIAALVKNPLANVTRAQYEAVGGNGGLSIRNVTAMLKLARQFEAKTAKKRVRCTRDVYASCDPGNGTSSDPRPLCQAACQRAHALDRHPEDVKISRACQKDPACRMPNVFAAADLCNHHPAFKPQTIPAANHVVANATHCFRSDSNTPVAFHKPHHTCSQLQRCPERDHIPLRHVRGHNNLDKSQLQAELARIRKRPPLRPEVLLLHSGKKDPSSHDDPSSSKEKRPPDDAPSPPPCDPLTPCATFDLSHLPRDRRRLTHSLAGWLAGWLAG